MLALLQRVQEARVTIAGATVGAIGPGLLVLLCAERGDTEDQAERMLGKILRLRIFSEPAAPGEGVARSGKMNYSVQDVRGGLLIVSQFTLAADASGGNRPSFTGAAPADEGRRLYDYTVQRARALHPDVQCGQFGADMKVALVNDGPVTIPLQVR
jgi:D-tyrosyl-tRNA(Tyr) deacylase